jgi:hypothetical protein
MEPRPLQRCGTSCIRGKNVALDYVRKRHFPTKLFKLLAKLEKTKVAEGMDVVEKEANLLHGNCKLPRFQYSNYGNDIVENRTKIHRIIREFLQFREGKELTVEKQHADLYVRLKSVKGIGPLSFNQLWHSLCLSGVLPHEYIVYSTISPSAGPAKLIQVFHGTTVNSTPKCEVN